MPTEQIKKIKELKKLGWTYFQLALEFNLDFHTIYDIVQNQKIPKQPPKSPPTFQEEKINPGRNYKDYLSEEEKKKLKAQKHFIATGR